MTDAELNEALAKAVGIQHRVTEEGKHFYYSPDPPPAYTRQYHAHRWPPQFLHDWAAMGLLVKAMQVKGWHWHAINFWQSDSYRVRWAWQRKIDPLHFGFGNSMPEAVARAAAAAMGIE